MRNWTLLIALSCIQWIQGFSQPMIQAEAGYWQFPQIDRIFKAYQLAHPWENEQVAPIGMSAGLAAGWNQKLFAPRGLHAIGMIYYRHQTTSWNNGSLPLKAGFHCAGVQILLRSHPRCLLQEVQQTGPLGTRWYVQMGSVYNWNLPFVMKYGERVTIQNNKPYRNLSGQIGLIAGTGIHAFTLGYSIFSLETTLTWYPRFELDEFATAILGHNEPSLINGQQNSIFIQAHIRATLQKKNKNWWDAPRSGDKS